LVPLLAGNLTASACCTQSRINKKRVSIHQITSLLCLSNVDHKGLGFRNPGIRITR
jgi:hypothetical protein